MDGQHEARAVVVGVDGSEFALRAVRWGAAEAARRNVPLRVVHVFEWMADRSRMVWQPGLEERYRDICLRRARRVTAAAGREAQEHAPGVVIERQLIIGSAVGVLSEESSHAQLVVVADRGQSRIDAMLLGSVPVALVVRSACPVVVVRGTERDPAESSVLPVVVGVDGSAMSEAAVKFAFDAASARGVPLVAVHTWSDHLDMPALAPLIDWDAVADEERRVLAERLAGWSEKYPEVRVESVLALARPARILLEQSARAQLVVVGSRRHGEVAGLLLGSVSNALVHKAECPVAVVQPDTGKPT